MGVCQKMLQRRGKEKRSLDGLRFPRSYVEGQQRRSVHQPHVKVRHRGLHIYDIHLCLCLHIDCQITQSRLCLEIGPPPLEVGAPSATTHAEATGTTGRWGHAVLPIQICLRDNPVKTSTSHSPCETAQWPVCHLYPAKVTHYKYINYISKGTGASGRIGPSAPPIVAWANLMERKWDKEVFATLLSGIQTYKFSLAANAVRQVTWDKFMTNMFYMFSFRLHKPKGQPSPSVKRCWIQDEHQPVQTFQPQFAVFHYFGKRLWQAEPPSQITNISSKLNAVKVQNVSFIE